MRARLDELEKQLEKLRTLPASVAASSVGQDSTASATVPAEVPPVIASPAVPPASLPTSTASAESATTIPPPSSPPVAPRESWEVRLGTVWLPRVGMLVLLTGVVFLVTWSYQYLGKAGKLALGYLLALVLGGGGAWLHRRLPAFSRVLLAGAFATAYYMTYAMHFVPALRVVDSMPVAVGLLVVLVGMLVVVADRAGSATLTVMALFFGYYTSLVSGVGRFTLTANAVLAVAALVLAGRHRWTPLSFGAIVATYVAYVWWVGQTGWEQFWERSLDAEQFRLRAGFLGLYWVIFTVSGLLVGGRATTDAPRGSVLDAAQRLGWLTLNNALLLLLFAGLMRRAYPGMGWAFYFPFAGVLCITAAVAYRRFAAERQLADGLFWQALLVGTLGLVSYFRSETLVGVLAAESVLVLMLARVTGSRGLRWVAFGVFVAANVWLWREWPDRDRVLLTSTILLVLAGWVNAILERRRLADAAVGFAWSAGLYAISATLWGWAVAADWVPVAYQPWVMIALAPLVATLGLVTRAREIVIAAHLPLLGGWITSLAAIRGSVEEWDLAPTLALIAVLWMFGLVGWARRRARPEVTEAGARRWLLPYALMAVTSMLVVVLDHCPRPYRWLVWGIEGVVLVIAGRRAQERLLAQLAFVPVSWGAIYYIWTSLQSTVALASPQAGWTNLVGAAIALFVAERVLARFVSAGWTSDDTRAWRGWLVTLLTVATIIGLRAWVEPVWLTVGWALWGVVLLGTGLAITESAYRWAGLATLGCALIRAVVYDLARLDTVYRIVTYLTLGAMLLALGFLYARWRERR